MKLMTTKKNKKNVNSKNTLKSDKTAARIVKDYFGWNKTWMQTEVEQEPFKR